MHPLSAVPQRQGRRGHLLGPIATLAIWLGLTGPASGQAPPAAPPETAADASSGARSESFVLGMIVRAEGGMLKNLVGTMTVPADWPGEQRIVATHAELPPGASVTYQTIENAARRMTIHIPSVAAGAEARALVTFQIEISPPEPWTAELDRWRAPDAARMERKMAVYLLPSPLIESDNAELRKVAEEVAGAKERALEKAIVIHDWVARTIRYENNQGRECTVGETLRQRVGDCDEKNSLAVAMCRAQHIPARLVRGRGHTWHEFYLVDSAGAGRWFSCDATAPGPVGSPRAALVLQKGDNISVQDPKSRRKVKQRFLEDTLVGQGHGGQARLQLICQTLDEWKRKGPLPYRGIVH